MCFDSAGYGEYNPIQLYIGNITDLKFNIILLFYLFINESFLFILFYWVDLIFLLLETLLDFL